MDSTRSPKPLENLESEILRVYEELDRRISLFKAASGLECVPGCGACCLAHGVEATAVETLPLARAILAEQQEAIVLSLIQERESREDPTCVLYRPDPAIPGNGSCSFYKARPLVCRLFGFASRKNKTGTREFVSCKVLRATALHLVLDAQNRMDHGLDIPGYQDSAMRLAVLDPQIGFRRLPINQAIRAAIERLHWQNKFSPVLF
jgi:Fe-S-cluster containining protein